MSLWKLYFMKLLFWPYSNRILTSKKYCRNLSVLVAEWLKVSSLLWSKMVTEIVDWNRNQDGIIDFGQLCFQLHRLGNILLTSFLNKILLKNVNPIKLVWALEHCFVIRWSQNGLFSKKLDVDFLTLNVTFFILILCGEIKMIELP